MKRLVMSIISVIVLFSLAGCQVATYSWENIKTALNGREAVIETYDESSQLIDQVEGNSVSIGTEESFSIKDGDGNTVSKSGVLSFTIGGKSMIHVGSSLIMRDKALQDRFREFSKTVDIENFDRSTPIVDRMVNSFKNEFTGKGMLILVRSQSGMPLAAFAGEKVSFFPTEADKTTAFLIDGMLLFIYRCDYTIYDLSLLQ